MLGRRGAPHDGVLGIVALVAERLVTAGQRIPSRSAKNCAAPALASGTALPARPRSKFLASVTGMMHLSGPILTYYGPQRRPKECRGGARARQEAPKMAIPL